MKKLSLLLPLLFCGCAGYGTITKNLAKDGAIIYAPTPYGTVIRIGDTKNTVRVPTPNGEIVINGK